MQETSFVPSTTSGREPIGVLVARHFDLTFRAMMRGPGAEHLPGFLRFVSGTAHPMGNVAIISDPTVTEETRHAAEPLVHCGAPAAVIFPYGAPAPAADVVRALGFTVEASMPAMAVDIEQMAPTVLPPGYDWARIGAGDEGEAWAEALAVGYGLPRPLADVFAPNTTGADMAPDAPLQFFAVLRDGRPVSTSVLYLADGLAGIYCVSTLPEERGRGLGAHATAEPLRAAARLGYRVGVLQSSPAGHTVYLGLGFGDYGQIPMFIRMPG